MATKKCNNCNNTKSICEFYKHKKTKDGLLAKCKSCIKKQNSTYSKTKDGLFTKIYGSQKRHSKIRGYNPPEYTKQELSDWMLCHPKFEELWMTYVKSNYKKKLVPSIDRKDDYKRYSFDNIQLMTWEENNKKGALDTIQGINNKKSKAVIGTNIKTGEIVKFNSTKEAERKLGVASSNISSCCSKKPRKNSCNKYYTVRTAGGYVWQYSNK